MSESSWSTATHAPLPPVYGNKGRTQDRLGDRGGGAVRSVIFAICPLRGGCREEGSPRLRAPGGMVEREKQTRASGMGNSVLEGVWSWRVL